MSEIKKFWPIICQITANETFPQNPYSNPTSSFLGDAKKVVMGTLPNRQRSTIYRRKESELSSS